MNIRDLQPASIWYYFDQLTKIPRPSHHESAVQQFVLDEANRLGLTAQRDAAGNIRVKKTACIGRESAQSIILQAHLDMVAQKNSDSLHCFETDPIQTYIDGDWVYARGTTLGADNGIGVAAALAVLAADDIAHGKIEALFTATEETGMDGAKGLQGGWLEGDILLNLDSETLGEVCIGCAGGIDGTFRLPLETECASGQAYLLSIRGLKGGHSGIDIIKQRGNAIKILVTLLNSLSGCLNIAYIQGGTLRNAIPREAEAVLTSRLNQADLDSQIQHLAQQIINTLPKEDQHIRIQLQPIDTPTQTWTHHSQQTVLRVLNILPNGIDNMSLEIDGLVETSSNLAKVQCTNDSLQVECLLRSQNDFLRDVLAQKMVSLFELAGGTGELSGAYTGWKPTSHTPLTQLMLTEGEKLLQSPPKITVIHAGLECGILATHYPHWQMASFGPTIEMPHSPDERVNIPSVAIFWDWLKNVLTHMP